MPKILYFPYSAVECPDDIVQKYKNATTTRPPAAVTNFKDILVRLLIAEEFVIGFNVVAVIFFLIVLFLNQRKNSKNRALYLFCLNYIGIQLILSLIKILFQMYKIIWKTIWYSNTFCLLDETFTPPMILWPVSHVFPKWYLMADAIRSLIDRSIYLYVLPILLGYHRVIVYFACSFPIVYKRYFKESMLKKYYILIYFFGLLIFIIRFFRNDFSSALYVFDAIFSFIQILSCLFHVILTILSIRIVLNYQKTKINDSSVEVKAFFYFSILPITLSSVSMLVNTVYIIASIIRYHNPKTSISSIFAVADTARAINDELIFTVNPLLSSLLILCCLPAFRKPIWHKIAQIFGCQTKTTVTSLNTNSVSSKISFTSQHISVTTHK